MEASAPLGMRAKGAGTGGRQGALPVHTDCLESA